MSAEDLAGATTETPPPEETPSQEPEGKAEGEEELSADQLAALRKELLAEIMAKETFIDPLTPDEVAKAYGKYEKEPQRIIDVLVQSFLQYCRKCIREAAVLRVKNEIAWMTVAEAEQLKTKVITELNAKVKRDPELELALMMLLFKNHYWNWVRYGLKDIFTQQRMQPGNPINQLLNARFHKHKNKLGFKTVADTVNYDLTEIVNRFKAEILGKKMHIFV